MKLRKPKGQSAAALNPTSGEHRIATVCSSRRHRRESGSSIVELALLSPWIFFLFVGVFDFGFYAYAAICTQNAARAVAVASAETATGGVTPCNAALGEMRMLPNVGSNPVFTCGAAMTVTQAIPVAVCVAALSNASPAACGSSQPACADCGQNAAATSEKAFVTYQTIPLVPIPGILKGQVTLTRVAEMRAITQ
jgi:Flp pilus assembly protein TadG